MAHGRLDVLDVREMLRRLRLGESARSVSRGLLVSRNTVREYQAWFAAEMLLPGDPADLPTARDLAERLTKLTPKVGPAPKLWPYREEIAELVASLQVKVALERFAERHPDVAVSYSVFLKFVRRYIAERRVRKTIRLEVGPGEEAQVDFGYAGLIPPRAGEAPRKTWVFVMTLSHSRHQYVELVQDQTVGTWLSLHQHAFEFFGGAPRKIVLDNLKAGVIGASVTDPAVQRAYRECAEHYGFVISPCVPYTPEHKGKVERGVGYVKRSFLAGRSFTSISEANDAALEWVVAVAGARVHGTTKEIPMEAFATREKATLVPLPSMPFELVEWREAKVHPDCHIVFDKAYYSAPHPLVGRRLWLRATAGAVMLFAEHHLVTTHTRASRPGQRMTHPGHLPPEKTRYLTEHPDWCRERATEIGEATSEFVDRLLGDRTLDRLRGAQATIRLAQAFGNDRLEAACRRALACDAVAFRTVRCILVRGLDREPLPGAVVPPAPVVPRAFARSFEDLFNPKGGNPWTSSIN
jgi:transposase